MLNTLIVLTDTFPIPGRKEFDAGTVSFEFNQFVHILRAFFLTSNAIRKERKIFLVIHQEKIVVKIDGNHLRYLAADFRTAGAIIVNFLQIIYPASNKKVMIKKREILQRKGSVLASPGIIIDRSQILTIESIIEPFLSNLYRLSIDTHTITQGNSVDIQELPLNRPLHLLIDLSAFSGGVDHPIQIGIENRSLKMIKKLGEDGLTFSEQILWLNYLEDNLQ